MATPILAARVSGKAEEMARRADERRRWEAMLGPVGALGELDEPGSGEAGEEEALAAE